MQGHSRKKIIEDNSKKGANQKLPSFAEHKTPENYDAEQDELIIVEKVEKKKNFSFKSVVVLISVVLILLIFAFALRFVNFNVTEMLWKVSLTRGSSEVNNKSIRYAGFLNGMTRVSNDGITYIDSKGSVRWTISYNMKDPIYESKGKYFAIAERNGFDFYIFDGTGIVGKNTSKYPIQKISLSDNGYIFLLQSDDENSYIDKYDVEGKLLSRTIRTDIITDGMPIDISASSDGDVLLSNCTCLSENAIYSKAVYYDEEGSFCEVVDELSDKFLARVHYFDEENSCLVFDTGIHFLNGTIVEKPSINVTHAFDDRIKSITYNHKFLSIVFDNKRFLIINKDGNIVSDKTIDFDYDNFYINDDYIIFLSADRVIIYDAKGRVIFDKEITQGIEYVAKKKSLLFTELLLGLVDGVECIRFY